MPLQRAATIAYPVITHPAATNATTTTTTVSPMTIGSTVQSSSSRLEGSDNNNNQNKKSTVHDRSASVFNPHIHGASSFSSPSSSSAFPSSSSSSSVYPTPAPDDTSSSSSTHTFAMPIDKSSTMLNRAIPPPSSASTTAMSLRSINNPNHNAAFNKYGFGGTLRVVYRDDSGNVNTGCNVNGNGTGIGDAARSKSEPLPDEGNGDVDVDVDMDDGTGEAGGGESQSSSTGSTVTVTPRQQQQQAQNQLWRSQSAYDIRSSGYVPLHQALGIINSNSNMNTPQNTTTTVPRPTIPSSSSSATQHLPLQQEKEDGDDAMEDVLSSDEYDTSDDVPVLITATDDEHDEFGLDDNMHDITPSQQDDWALLLSQHPDPPPLAPAPGPMSAQQGPISLATNTRNALKALSPPRPMTNTDSAMESPHSSKSTIQAEHIGANSSTVLPRPTPSAAQPQPSEHTLTPTPSMHSQSQPSQSQSQPATQAQQIQPSLGLGPAPSRVPTPLNKQTQPGLLNRKHSMAATEILDPEPQDIVKELKEMGIKVRDFAYIPRAKRGVQVRVNGKECMKGTKSSSAEEGEAGGEKDDDERDKKRSPSEKAKGKQKALEPGSAAPNRVAASYGLTTTTTVESNIIVPIPPSTRPGARMNLPTPKVPIEIFDPYKSVTEVDYRWSLPTSRRRGQGASAAVQGKVLHHLLEIGWLSRTEMWARASADDLKSLENYLEGIERWGEICKRGAVIGEGRAVKEGGDNEDNDNTGEEDVDDDEEVLSIHAFQPQPYPWVSLPFNCIPSLEQRRDMLNARRAFWAHMDEMREAAEITERREKRDRRTGREGRRRAGMREREMVAAAGAVAYADEREGSVERGTKRRAEEDDERVPSPPGERQRSVSVNGRKRRKMSPELESEDEDDDGEDDSSKLAKDVRAKTSLDGEDEDDTITTTTTTTTTTTHLLKRDKTPESDIPEPPPKNRYINPFQGLENIVHIHPSSDVNPTGPASQNRTSGADDDEDADPYKGLTEEERAYQIELDEEEEEYQRELQDSLREMVRQCAGVEGEDGVRRRWWEFEMSELRRGGVGRNGIVRRRVGAPPRHISSFEGTANDEEGRCGGDDDDKATTDTKVRTNAMLNPYAGDKVDEVDPRTFTYKQWFRKPERLTRGAYTAYPPPPPPPALQQMQQMQQRAGGPGSAGPIEGEGADPSKLRQWAVGVRQAQGGRELHVEMSPFVQLPGGGAMLERTDTPPLSEAEQAANAAFANGRRGHGSRLNGNTNAHVNASTNGNASAAPGRGRGLTRSYTNEGMPGGHFAGRGNMPVWGVPPSASSNSLSASPGITPPTITTDQAAASTTTAPSSTAIAPASATTAPSSATTQVAPLKRQAKPLGATTTLASIPVDVNASFRVPVTRSMSVKKVGSGVHLNGNGGSGSEMEQAKGEGREEVPEDGADTESEGGDTEAED